MSNNSSKVKRGNYITKISEFDIYLKFKYETKTDKRKISGHQFDIYFAKRLVEGGFKTKDLAISKIQEFVENNVKPKKNKKK